MVDPGALMGHWGYVAIFALVVVGNMGVPMPEETVLLLAGYMVWHGDLRLSVVLVLGITSAVVGDNLGYWIARRYGRAAFHRHGPWLLGSPARLAAMRSFVERRGPLAVFVARFLPGLRFAAGPLAGALGLRFGPFFAANVLGAAVYVPAAVGAGYAVGYGLGEYVERLRRVIGGVESLVLAAALCGAVLLLGWRAVRARRRRRPSA